MAKEGAPQPGKEKKKKKGVAPKVTGMSQYDRKYSDRQNNPGWGKPEEKKS